VYIALKLTVLNWSSTSWNDSSITSPTQKLRTLHLVGVLESLLVKAVNARFYPILALCHNQIRHRCMSCISLSLSSSLPLHWGM